MLHAWSLTQRQELHNPVRSRHSILWPIPRPIWPDGIGAAPDGMALRGPSPHLLPLRLRILGTATIHRQRNPHDPRVDSQRHSFRDRLPVPELLPLEPGRRRGQRLDEHGVHGPGPRRRQRGARQPGLPQRHHDPVPPPPVRAVRGTFCQRHRGCLLRLRGAAAQAHDDGHDLCGRHSDWQRHHDNEHSYGDAHCGVQDYPCEQDVGLCRRRRWRRWYPHGGQAERGGPLGAAHREGARVHGAMGRRPWA